MKKNGLVGIGLSITLLLTSIAIPSTIAIGTELAAPAQAVAATDLFSSTGWQNVQVGEWSKTEKKRVCGVYHDPKTGKNSYMYEYYKTRKVKQQYYKNGKKVKGKTRTITQEKVTRRGR